MFNRVKKYIILSLLIAASGLFAQEFQVKHYVLNSQLPDVSVYSGFQDKYGFLWFSTQNGIYRFSGNKTELIDFGIKSENVKKIQANFIQSIFSDSKGYFWIALNKGIIKSDGSVIKKFNFGNEYRGLYIKIIKETDDGSIWFCDDNHLLRIKNSELKDFTKTANIYDSKIQKRKNRERIINIFLDTDKKLLLFTNKGIKKFNGKSFDWIDNNPAKFDNNNFCLRINSDTLLLGGNSGNLKLYEGRSVRSISLGDGNAIYYIFKDSFGVNWIGTKNGLFEFSRNQVKHIETAKDPKAASVLSIFEDNERNIWVCTVRDIFKIQRTDFSKIVTQTISGNIVFNGIVEDSRGKLWFSANKGRLYTYENGIIKSAPVNFDKKIEFIKDIAINKNDEIWLNTKNGLIKIKNNKSVTYQELNGIRTRMISHLIINDRNEIYFIDSAKNLRVYDGDKIFTPQKSNNVLISTLMKNNKGTICIRAKDEISAINGSYSFDLKEYNKKINYVTPTFTLIDKDGDVWLLTHGKGIFFIDKDNKTITNISTNDGLIDNRVIMAFQDRSGYIWFGARSGISRFDTKSFKTSGRKLFENFRNPDNEISRLVKMFFQDRNGNIWAATTHGLLKFDIRIVKEEIDYSPPKIYITGIKLFLDKFNYLDYSEKTDGIIGMPLDMRLPYNRNYLTFNFVGLNYKEPDAVEYQYKLTGFDAAWSPNVKFDEVTYTNLPPGKYMFEVKARNKDGQWSVKPASISFEILPPFWKTWWFYSLSFITLLSLIGAYINIKTRSLKKQKLILEKTVEERTIELKSEKMKVEAANQDLEKSRYQLAKINELQEKWLKELSESEQELLESNESKDKLFSLISHDLRSPFRSLLVYSEGMMKRLDEMTHEEIKNYLKNVHKSAENIYGLVEDLLEWSRVHTGRMECNPTLFDVSCTVNELINVLSANAEKKKISIINNVEENCLINADKGMIKSVINNLISNGIKFTYSGGVIEISAQTIEDMVEISVKDDGVGLSPTDMEKLFKVGSHFHTEGTEKEKGTGLGLILCKELIEKNGGTISVLSKLGDGSTFIISLPRNGQK